MNLRFICAQPAIPYYVWQVEVMINNFISMGIDPKNIDIVCWRVDGASEQWDKLVDHYKEVRFSFYNDTRETRNYISSIRPNILKQHFLMYPNLEKEAIFYHDCDIAFTKPINWEQFLDDDKWYGSDCRWYIAHSYIKGKGEDVLDLMCNIAKIPKFLVEKNELNSIGAQYLMKGVNWRYWAEVEEDCENMFKQVSELNREKKRENPTYHELQIWCADMWAVLWGAWKSGKETICHPDLEFSWATSTEADWDRLNIFHNAGVTGAEAGLFYKAQFMNKLPYNMPMELKEGSASKKYWELIQETAKKSCLI